MSAVLPAIIGAGASLVGGLVNNEYAQARSDQQWYRMNEMQDKMNAYNAPVAQMARLREAGLNPNLVYANGGAVMQSAVGNAPNPPNTAPLDTQGVLQMVQTIVGAMLEKDKIQAQKDVTEMQTQSNEKVAEGHDTTQKEVTGMQTKSSERNIDVTTQSNEKISTERNETEKGIADENRKENARQFDLSFEHQRIMDFARLSVEQSLANSTIALHASQVELNHLSAQLSRELQPYLVDKAKYEAVSLGLNSGNAMLDSVLDREIYISEDRLKEVYKDSGLSVPPDSVIRDIAAFHNRALWLYDRQLNHKDKWFNWDAFWASFKTPMKVGTGAAAVILTKGKG